jgi:hypothetical protein
MIKNVLTKFASLSFLTGMFFVSATFAQEPPASAAGTALQEVQQKSNE